MKSFLYVVSKNIMKFTILMHEVWVLLFLFSNLNFFGKIFWIWFGIEVSVGWVSIPIISCFQLVREICIVIFLWLFSLEFFCVSTFATKWEITSCVFVSRLNILIITPMAGELAWIRSQIRWRTIVVKQILRMRPLQLISIFSSKALKVSWIHVKMRPLQSIILVGKHNRSWNRFLIVETFLIYCSLGKVRFNHMELTQMSSTLALITYTLVGIVVAKIGLCQFRSSFIEGILIMRAFRVVVPWGVQRLDSRCFGIRELKLVSLVRRVSPYPRFHLRLESWLGSWRWGWTLRWRSHAYYYCG